MCFLIHNGLFFLYFFSNNHRIPAPSARPTGKLKIGSHIGPMKTPNSLKSAEKLNRSLSYKRKRQTVETQTAYAHHRHLCTHPIWQKSINKDKTLAINNWFLQLPLEFFRGNSK